MTQPKPLSAHVCFICQKSLGDAIYWEAGGKKYCAKCMKEWFPDAKQIGVRQ